MVFSYVFVIIRTVLLHAIYPVARKGLLTACPRTLFGLLRHRQTLCQWHLSTQVEHLASVTLFTTTCSRYHHLDHEDRGSRYGHQ